MSESPQSAGQWLIIKILITFVSIIYLFFSINTLDSAEIEYELPKKIEYEDILTREQVRELVAQYPDWNVELMTNIAFCESSFRKEVVNPEGHNGCSGSTGIFQIACLHTNEDLKDPEINVKWANKIYNSQGLNAWKICYNKYRD